MTSRSSTATDNSRPLPNSTPDNEKCTHDSPKQPLEVSDSPPPPPPPPITFPEGGTRAWLTVLGGTITIFCTFGVVQSFGVYQDYYTRNALSEHTPSEISWIGSMQVFLVFAVGLPAGKLFDLGYFHHLMISGSLLYLFSAFMLSLTKPHHYYQVFLAQSIGEGLGMGIMFVPSLAVSSHYFRRKRSLAMGLVIVGASIGGCLYPIMLNNIFQRAGFAWGVRAVAFLDLGLLVVANLIMRTRLPPNRKKGNNTALFKELFTDVPYLMYSAGTFLVFWGSFIPFFYLQLFAALHRLNATFTKYSLTIMNASSILGRIVPNLIADRYGPLNIMIISSLITGVLVFALFGATSEGGAAAFGIFYGFFSGGTISLATPALTSFVTHSDGSDLPLRIALLSFILSLPLLTGNPLAGALLSPPHYFWFRPIILASVFLLAGTGFYIVAWKLLQKRKQSTFV